MIAAIAYHMTGRDLLGRDLLGRDVWSRDAAAYDLDVVFEPLSRAVGNDAADLMFDNAIANVGHPYFAPDASGEQVMWELQAVFLLKIADQCSH